MPSTLTPPLQLSRAAWPLRWGNSSDNFTQASKPEQEARTREFHQPAVSVLYFCCADGWQPTSAVARSAILPISRLNMERDAERASAMHINPKKDHDENRHSK